jgi:hypothetical protein
VFWDGGAMTDALSPRMKKKFAVYKPRPRAPNEALPQTMDLWKQPTYKPTGFDVVRPGADDNLQIHSRGVST